MKSYYQNTVFILFISVLFFACNTEKEVEIKPGNEAIHYSGRWKNLDSTPQCTWQGSSIFAKFKGSSISAIFEGGTESQDFKIIIDDDKVNAKRITISAQKQSVILAENLTNEIHKIEIVKETYNGNGITTFYGFVVNGKGIVDWEPEKPQTKILFYGDSNMDGTSLESEKNSGVNGAYFSFASVASRMLNAEYHNLSVGGAVLTSGKNSGLWFHNRFDRHSEKTDWNYKLFSPDIVVINLGANDVSKRNKVEIKAEFKRLISVIRKTHGSNPYIVLMNGYGWSRDEPANYNHEVVSELKDPRLSAFVFPWLFNEWHGCEYDHAGMAQILVEHIVSTVPGIKQVNSIDNLNGFGQNGNVANGSFEKVANFGGYAWRYFEDGAERIHSKENAGEGEYFIRLKEGTEIHQPCPAEGGVEYLIKIKMKGIEPVSTGKIEIEFRDQNYRDEIPRSRKVFSFNPETNWKEFTATFKAPEKQVPGNPSYDVWKFMLRIKCEKGEVDIDDVVLSINQ